MSYDRVKETWTGIGTGTFNLSGVAVTGFRTLAGVVPSGNYFDYVAVLNDDTEWEVGVGVYTPVAGTAAGGGTLTREKVYASSNSGSKVNFSAGTKYIFGNLPATKWILSNLILYLDPTSSDTTGDGTSGSPWATVPRAQAWLWDKRINRNSLVTIQCADGNYATTSPIVFDHPCGDRINLAGTNTYTKSMTAVVSSSGSLDVVIALNNVTNISTSDLVLISAASGGTKPLAMEGCWPVTNVDSVNSRITVHITTNQIATYVPSGAVAATVTVLKSVISATGCQGIEISRGRTLQSITNLGLKGNATANKYGLAVGGSFDGSAYITGGGGNLNLGASVGLNGWNVGISVFDGSSLCSQAPTYVSGCGIGLGVFRLSSVDTPNIVLSGCTTSGLRCAGTTNVRLSSSRLIGNVQGAYGSQGAVSVIDSSVIDGNTTGIYAEKYAYTNAVSVTLANNTTNSSPGFNVQGNDYAFIKN